MWTIVSPTGFVPEISFSDFYLNELPAFYVYDGDINSNVLFGKNYNSNECLYKYNITATNTTMTLRWSVTGWRSWFDAAHVKGIVRFVQPKPSNLGDVSLCSSSRIEMIYVPITNTGTVFSSNLLTNNNTDYGVQDCRWLITAPIGQVPEISFTQFYTTSDSRQSFSAYDGKIETTENKIFDSDSDFLNACSYTQTIRGRSNIMSITYHARDNLNPYPGMIGTVNFVNKSIPKPDSVSRCSAMATIITNTNFSTNAQGDLKYSIAKCTWTLQPPSGLVPKIVFDSFVTNNFIDYFSVYNGYIINQENLLFTYSGMMHVVSSPYTIQGSVSGMTIVFEGNSPGIGTTGVKGIFTFIEPTPELDNVSRCSAMSIINKNNTIFSTNAKDELSYRNNSNCTWSIQAPAGYYSEVQMISGNAVFPDIFEIFDQGFPAPKYDTGFFIPDISDNVLPAADANMTLRFTSDNSNTRTGVSGVVMFYPILIPEPDTVSRCSENSTITTNNTEFSTNERYVTTYNSMVQCTWFIRAPLGTFPSFNITMFDTLQNDFFSMYYGDDINTAQKIYNSDGTIEPVPFTVDTNSTNVILRFISNQSNWGRQGVTGTVTFI
jgi:hypothetical protein